MKLKEKFQRFWTLSGSRKGFTLVELIVVIAILAILAGVAIPVYNGYIKKAQSAADQQLLDTINTAFAAACLENGDEISQVKGASMPLNGDKSVNVAGVQPYGEDFAFYFQGNETAKFSVFTSIVYDASKGMFVNSADAESIMVNVGGNVYVANGQDIQAWLNGSMGQNMSSGELTGLAADTAGIVFELYSGSYISDLLGSESYSDAINGMFGMDYSTYENQQFEKWAAENAADLDLANRFDRAEAYDKWTNSDSGKTKFDQNLMILTSVNQAGEAGKTILDELRNGTAKNTIINNLTGASGGEQAAMGLSQSALAYGLYVSYAGSGATVSDFTAALGDPNSDFSKYLQEDQAETDLKGVLGAMNVISQQDKATLDSVVTDGIGNDNLAAALQQILGK